MSNTPRTAVILAGQERYVSDVDETGLGAVDAVSDSSAPSSMWGEAWKNLRIRPLFWIAAAIMVFMFLLALFPSLFTSQDPRFCELSNSLKPPSSGHFFGYDRQGCDVFSRVVYGTRASLSVGVLATFLSVVVGATIGALAGFLGGWFDTILSRITDIFFAIPFVLAAIVAMQMFKENRDVFLLAVVLAAFGWTQIARITRGAVLSTKNEEFVTASIAVGKSKMRTLITHIVPNALAPIIVYATVALGAFIVSEATLSFLGIGLPPEVVSWGGDISRAQASLRSQPTLLFYPAGALALTVLAFTMMGDVVRDALDPKARKR
ncbi:ABC transporter permease [Boudabousia marimammalium]|uniref:Peptide ABC transporter permease n=1 Tax=Boudabousia marimammalium TaxID=156892 RepID=A0A1Q5PM81_9ACTO|nr:ABC transporter permease [Boudabousia marimammalium]OKL48651.1 peptide ABC transporter permease [Boudabousia marimammalium]